MRQLFVVLLLIVVVAVAACGSDSAVGLDGGSSGQPTLLTPPDDETPVLYPPDAEPGYPGEAYLVILVDNGDFDDQWREMHSIAEGVGGWISSAYTGLGEDRGHEYEFGTAIVEVPSHEFDRLLSRLGGLGERISSELSIYSGGEDWFSTISVTLTESASPFYSISDPEPEGRVDRALDTAGDVLLTIVSVLIVAGAVIAPVLILSLLGYWVWRSLRRRWPIAEAGAEAKPASETIET